MNPFRDVWTKPRETIREIASSRPGYLFVPLAGIYGATHNLNKVISRGVDPSLGFGSLQVLVSNRVFGFLFGIAVLYAGSHALAWVGRRLGGVAGPPAVRTVLAWASVPFIPLLLIGIALALLGPSTLIVRPQHFPIPMAGILHMTLWALLSAWLCYIGVVGLSEVEGFSVGRSVATYLIVVAGFVLAVLAILTIVVAVGRG